jgi:GNAT superfamily N-acetyltransferase
MIPDGYTDLPLGKIAAVVTYLEMRSRPACAEISNELTLQRVLNPDLQWYRGVFLRVGGPWLWFSRLEMSDEQLAYALNRPTTELFTAEHAGCDIGIAELDRSSPHQVEITFFGLYPEALGKGLGMPFMSILLDRAWDESTSRVWVHTCTLDAPSALPFYLKCGFRAYKRAIEVADDPRLRGLLPEDAAPQVPIIG